MAMDGAMVGIQNEFSFKSTGLAVRNWMNSRGNNPPGLWAYFKLTLAIYFDGVTVSLVSSNNSGF